VTETALAEGIVRVANANMERAIRVVSVQRGFDPRDFALLAFGGAGGMHACEIAGTLEISTVIVPRYAGVLSALGMLLADVTRDYSHTVLRQSKDLQPEVLDELFAPLVERATAELAAEGFTGSSVRLSRTLDVRYVGQAFEIMVPLGPRYREEFDAAHARLYGYSNPMRATEIVNLRLTATGITRKPDLPRTEIGSAVQAVPVRLAPARFGGRTVQTSFYRWEDLEPGSVAEGPAVVAGGQATAVVTPGFRFRIDESGNLIAARTAAPAGRRKRRTAVAAVTQ
jgi:N-methylhydantoinase A/oxoprolinase/acetone carboxylase beta subunit